VRRFRLFCALALLALPAACDAPLDVDPRAAIPMDGALGNARAVAAAVVGLYDSFQTESLYSRELVVYPDLYADNLHFTGTFGTDREVDARNVRPGNGALLAMWRDSYAGINQANEVLHALDVVADLTPEQRARFRGEALFARSLHYLNLVRYFGGVPLVTERVRTLDDVARAARPRSTEAAVYARIESDLAEAAPLLPARPVPGRATRDAANALLARAYLEQRKWPLAAERAGAVIASGQHQLAGAFRDLFQIKNGPESLFELQYTAQDANSLAFWFFPNRDDLGGRWGFAPTTSQANTRSGDPSLRALYDFEDARRAATFAGPTTSGGRYYGTKYFRVATGDDNVIVLRLAEMYLVRAEARAWMGADAATVLADVNVLRRRAGTSERTSLELDPFLPEQAQLVGLVLQERRLEFALEGHRFFDLRRAGRAEAVLGLDATRLLFPIPQQEIDVNPLLEQNPGY
jgi:starch-binding outer membrane protein, SusD/RagB family